MNVELLKRIKKLQKLTNEELSQKSGIPIGTLNKILSGATKSPRHDTIEAISKALNCPHYDSQTENSEIIKEALAYDVTRKYTVDDYYALPEDVRVELIDGTFYFMEAPGAAHQTIIGEMYYAIKRYIKSHKGNCRVFLSPIDVKLDNDNKTMVQPDLMVICDRKKVDKRRCNGAPDFLVEIVSKSSSRLDYIKKLNKYLDAGVREYWIVDPDKRTITAYRFEQDTTPINYTFSDRIPVGIWEDCTIDFNEVEKELHFSDET